jgi:hypothetical protein
MLKGARPKLQELPPVSRVNVAVYPLPKGNEGDQRGAKAAEKCNLTMCGVRYRSSVLHST